MKQVTEILDWMIDNSDELSYTIYMDNITYDKFIKEYQPKEKFIKYRNLEFNVQDSIYRYIRIV